MSHMVHINNYKVELIKQGITDPEDQIAIVRTAYTCAFIRLFTHCCVPEEDRLDVMHYLLAYWNEKFPVNGPYVISTVKGFYERLNSALGCIKSPILSQITRDEAVDKNPLYYEIAGYEEIVETLVHEATHKYRERLKGE